MEVRLEAGCEAMHRLLATYRHPRRVYLCVYTCERRWEAEEALAVTRTIRRYEDTLMSQPQGRCWSCRKKHHKLHLDSTCNPISRRQGSNDARTRYTQEDGHRHSEWGSCSRQHQCRRTWKCRRRIAGVIGIIGCKHHGWVGKTPWATSQSHSATIAFIIAVSIVVIVVITRQRSSWWCIGHEQEQQQPSNRHDNKKQQQQQQQQQYRIRHGAMHISNNSSRLSVQWQCIKHDFWMEYHFIFDIHDEFLWRWK